MNFNNDIVNDHNSKSFKYKVKLLVDMKIDGANEILRNITLAVPLTNLSDFWRSLRMPLHEKVE